MGICPVIVGVIDVARLIPDTRTVDVVLRIECKAIIQADMVSQYPVDKPPAGEFRHVNR